MQCEKSIPQSVNFAQLPNITIGNIQYLELSHTGLETPDSIVTSIGLCNDAQFPVNILLGAVELFSLLLHLDLVFF